MTGGETGRLDALQRALRRAFEEERIGAPRAFHWLACLPGTPELADDLLRRTEELLSRSCLDRLGTEAEGETLILARWAGGETATIAASAGPEAALIDLVVLGNRGSLAYRWAGGEP